MSKPEAGTPSPPAPGSAEHKAALFKSLDAIKAGYGGVMPNGNIVDRREIPSAIPIPANSLMGTPEPKVLWQCPVCGYVMTEEQSKGYRGCPTGLHIAQHVALLPNAALSGVERKP